MDSLKSIRHIISIKDFSRQQIIDILKFSAQMESCRDNSLGGQVLATLFFEPSTRTRLSFETAMLQLGGKTLGFSDAMSSSTKKGETLADSIKVTSQYADIIVIRHHLEGAARVAAESSRVPVINGGDGSNQHPTQTFLDLYTISKSHPEYLEGKELTVALLGDLRYGRTVHSLIHALAYFKVKFVLISPPSLRLPETYLNFLRRSKIDFREVNEVEGQLDGIDVLYATRIQEERFPDPVEYMKVRRAYCLKADHFNSIKEGFQLLHPLPRITEIDQEVDDLELAQYFPQAGNGVPVRKALLSLLMNQK